ncbi:MAG: type III-B CRISPR module-associated protein Cmr5 [Thermodesulfobacterium sp.]|nr:type III-B CRISPR module-associated protein Cmr5 [Thermodesulfobacterium sp.]
MRNVRKTEEQKRASFCLAEIKSFKSKHKNNEESLKKFKTSARSLPQCIVSDGLLPTLVFYKSKEEKKSVYELLNKWLREKRIINNDALEEIAEADAQILRLATMEALAFGNWLKRLVEVEIEK